KVPAERALRQLARERPADPETQERLIRFLREAGRPKDALAAAQDLVRRYGDDDSFSAASARCAAARQLDAMGQHEDALTMVERFAEVFPGRPAPDVKPAIEAMLGAAIAPQLVAELGPPLAKAGAAAHAFEVYALLSQKGGSEKRARFQFSAWSALRAAKGA